jgi:hypothetical protein
MTTQEFESAKSVDYSSYEREIRGEFNALKRKMREQGCSDELMKAVEDAYNVSANAITSIQADNRKINKMAWHLANLM